MRKMSGMSYDADDLEFSANQSTIWYIQKEDEKIYNMYIPWLAVMKGPRPLQSLFTNVTFHLFLSPFQSNLPTSNTHALAVL